jgi:hypothetical protein
LDSGHQQKRLDEARVESDASTPWVIDVATKTLRKTDALELGRDFYAGAFARNVSLAPG